MSNYLQSIQELALPIVSMHQKELIDVKLRKEFDVNIISVIIDDPETFSMDIDEVALINSELLDEVNDLIPDGYYLEVTTPGIERELQTEIDFQRAIGKYIYIKTYQKLEEYHIKEITGTLLETTESAFVVETLLNQRKKVVTVPRTAVAKIRLAVKF
ncbi:MAG: ribosome maturation factor RimP [Prevotella sp.]|nr:ribosome maturation factor RimP [Staphylococcus sp.]MCM1350984.1 ribosome maturation factor RimP [Prevotella sp.]